jgi:hypothetical protein
MEETQRLGPRFDETSFDPSVVEDAIGTAEVGAMITDPRNAISGRSIFICPWIATVSRGKYSVLVVS